MKKLHKMRVGSFGKNDKEVFELARDKKYLLKRRRLAIVV